MRRWVGKAGYSANDDLGCLNGRENRRGGRRGEDEEEARKNGGKTSDNKNEMEVKER